MSSDQQTYEGQCYCGTVKILDTGDPVGAGYCHCAACRSWSAGPVNAFTLWPPQAVQVTAGEDQIGEFNANERSYRQWCKVCGGHLLTRHPHWDLVDVYAATTPTFAWLTSTLRLRIRASSVARSSSISDDSSDRTAPYSLPRLLLAARRTSSRPLVEPAKWSLR